MTILSVALCLLITLPASAALTLSPAERVAAVVEQAGLAMPAPQAYEAPAAAPVKGRAAALAAGTTAASGTGYVNGSGSMHCSAPGRGTGHYSGWINLSGDILVTDQNGARGNIRVSGTGHLSGSCTDGSGHVTGNTSLSGSGTLYKDGRAAGRVSVSGTLFVSRYVHGSTAWINEHVTVTGYSYSN